jgi:bacteriocin biosynthesis cyclodehydratase domain-containing protein
VDGVTLIFRRSGTLAFVPSPATAIQPRQRVEDLRRPALLPGLVRLRRDATSVQLGVEPPHAVVLSGLSPGHRALLGSLDGRLDHDGLNALAAQVGLGVDEVDHLLGLLAQRGLLLDAEDEVATPGRDDAERARLAPDLASLSLQHQAEASPRAVLERRHRAWIDVRGSGRVGSAIAVLVGAAGVGRVTVADHAPAGPGDLGPAGLDRFDLGYSRELATRERVRAFAPSVSVARRATPARPELVVLAPEAGPDPALVASWARRTTPHLLAFVRETTGVVGPLVVPGQTGCLVCLDLHRRDRDPMWPTIAAQLGRYRSRACDVVLATLVAAQAAMQVLAYLDGCATAIHGGTLETSLQSGMTRRRSWLPHPSCGCRWAQLADQAPDAPAR